MRNYRRSAHMGDMRPDVNTVFVDHTGRRVSVGEYEIVATRVVIHSTTSPSGFFVDRQVATIEHVVADPGTIDSLGEQ